MEALTRKYVYPTSTIYGMTLTHPRFTLHPTLSLQRIAATLPFTYTGADFYALCSDAMLKAVTRQATLVDAKVAAINSQNVSAGRSKISTAYFFDHYASKEDVAVMVTEDDFLAAERELVPSVSVKELEHYGSVRAMFEKVEDKKPASVDSNTQASNGRGKGKAMDGGGTIPDWQSDGHRPPSSRSNGRGKGKEKAMDVKGKGKAVPTWDQGSDDDEAEEGKFFAERTNGFSTRSKGKGKAVGVDMGFQEGHADDDEGLY
jgi:peroxin-6